MAERGLRAELVPPTSERWPAVLARLRHDLYHLPGYAAFSARWEEQGEPVAFVAEEGDDAFLLPLVLRDIPAALDDGGSRRDAISPKFYPGPVLSEAAARDGHGFVARAIASLKETLRERGVVSAFVRMHPLFTPPLAAFGEAGTVIDMGDTVSVDLRLSEEALWQQTRHNHRRDINKARRAGYHFELDPGWSHLDAFVEIYRQTMVRLEAHPSWHLSRDYFAALHEHVGEHVTIGFVEREGELASAALLTHVGDMVEYHLGGTLDAHLPMRPAKLLLHEAALWARQSGADTFHLAGSLRRGDKLEHFKLGFSPLTHRVDGWQLVADERGYAELTGRWSEQHGSSVVGAAGSFFPAYRAPAPVPA